MSVESFGRMPDGAEVKRLRLSGGGLAASVLTWGAVLQELWLDGHPAPLVLGFPEFAPYLTDSPYFGATAARCANRIRDGHVELDGRTFQLDRNFLGKHHLHGGSMGAGKRLWRLGEAADDAVQLEITLENGEMGYPGRLELSATFSLLPGGVLDVVYEATTDAPTLCNPAHHSYFVLDDSGSILDHTLHVAAESYLPVDEELIPTGEVRPVDGTPLDFRQPRRIGEASAQGLLDHNFCLADERHGLRPVAWLASERSGVSMEVRTTEPGLQVYDGAKLDVGPRGLAGQAMRSHAGIALEPQVWPDANHHSGFPQAVLRPGETYRQHTQFAFMRA